MAYDLTLASIFGPVERKFRHFSLSRGKVPRHFHSWERIFRERKLQGMKAIERTFQGTKVSGSESKVRGNKSSSYCGQYPVSITANLQKNFRKSSGEVGGRLTFAAMGAGQSTHPPVTLNVESAESTESYRPTDSRRRRSGKLQAKYQYLCTDKCDHENVSQPEKFLT